MRSPPPLMVLSLGPEPPRHLPMKSRQKMGCGLCSLDLYAGGKGWIRRDKRCKEHLIDDQPVYVCPVNTCSKILRTAKELKKHKQEHESKVTKQRVKYLIRQIFEVDVDRVERIPNER